MKAQSNITNSFKAPSLSKALEYVRHYHEGTQETRFAIIEEVVDSITILETEFTDKFQVFRARRVDADTVAPDYVDGLLWPKTQVTQAGRMNVNETPILYASAHGMTTLAETDPTKDHAIMAQFQVRPERGVRIATVGEFIRISRMGTTNFIQDPKIVSKVSQELGRLPKERLQSLLILDHLLLRSIMSNDPGYTLSTKVSACVFKKLRLTHAIGYPSVKHAWASNLAVKGQGFWGTWGLKSAIGTVVTELDAGVYDVPTYCGVTSIGDDGSLSWIEVEDGKQLSRKRLWVPPEYRS